MSYKNLKITMWDFGGLDDKIRPLWRHYFKDIQGQFQHMILSCDEQLQYDCLHGKNNAMVTDAQLCLWNLLMQFPNKIDFVSTS